MTADNQSELSPSEFNALWILQHMPDSSAMRRKLLQNIQATVTDKTSPIRRKAHEMLAALDVFDAEQRSLPFQQLTQDGNGR
jgi:hypothetical protein